MISFVFRIISQAKNPLGAPVGCGTRQWVLICGKRNLIRPYSTLHFSSIIASTFEFVAIMHNCPVAQCLCHRIILLGVIFY